MPRGMYLPTEKLWLQGAGPDLLTHTIKAVLIDLADYTPNLVTHDFLDDVPAAARGGTPQTLASKTLTVISTGVVFDAANPVFPAVAGPDSYEAVLLYRDTGVESTSPLIWLEDQGTGLPVTASGVDITVTFSDGTDKIFRRKLVGT